MIDIATEKLVTLTEAARLLPRIDGKSLSPNAIWRWCMKGVGQEKVKLDHVCIGRRVCTSEEALHRFMQASAEDALERLNKPAHLYFPKPPRGRTEKQRELAIAAASERLKKAGFLD